MPPEMQAIVDEINQIKQRLDAANDTSPHYMEPLLSELRNYVFLMHAEYERSMEVLIISRHLRRDQAYDFHLPLLESITFEGKMNLVKLDAPDFPLKTAKTINMIRNKFAHKTGQQLRTTYDDKARLMIYRRLDKAKTKLDEFWELKPLDP